MLNFLEKHYVTLEWHSPKDTVTEMNEQESDTYVARQRCIAGRTHL